MKVISPRALTKRNNDLDRMKFKPERALISIHLKFKFAHERSFEISVNKSHSKLQFFFRSLQILSLFPLHLQYHLTLPIYPGCPNSIQLREILISINKKDARKQSKANYGEIINGILFHHFADFDQIINKESESMNSNFQLS